MTSKNHVDLIRLDYMKGNDMSTTILQHFYNKS